MQESIPGLPPYFYLLVLPWAALLLVAVSFYLLNMKRKSELNGSQAEVVTITDLIGSEDCRNSNKR